MRPATAAALQDVLDQDLVWRRRELTSLITTIKSSDLAVKNVLIRAGVPLLYAHWEGFGRTCFLRYLEHVSCRSIKYRNLHPAFLYLSSLGRMQEISRAPAKIGVALLPQILNLQEDTNRNPFRKMVDTKSNLRFDVLEHLCCMSGIDPTVFIGDETFINNELCDTRNEIAHGGAYAPSEQDFGRRRDRTFLIMTKLQTQVVNSAVNQSYKLA